MLQGDEDSSSENSADEQSATSPPLSDITDTLNESQTDVSFSKK